MSAPNKRKIATAWEGREGFPNSILRGDGFYISYNVRPGSVFQMWSADTGDDETALVKDNKFYILNGDFREEYERLVPKGFDACLAYFRKKKSSCVSLWSDQDEATP